MTKGKKAVSKTNESTSEKLRRALRFGRGDTGQSEDVYALNINSLEAVPEEISGLPNLPLTVEIPLVRIPDSHCLHVIASS